MRFLAILAVFSMGFSISGFAAEETLVKPGQTVLNISASERVVAQQDQLIAALRYETDAGDARTLQDKINTLMGKALELAKKYKDVKVSTDNYYTYPYDPNPQPVQPHEQNEPRKMMWRGSQGLNLTSKNSEQLLKLTGELQDMGLQMGNLSYTLSTESFETIRDSLLESALKKLSDKAKRAAAALGKSESELVEVNVDVGYPQPPMMMARAEMAMDMGAPAKVATPSASPGESEIILTVSARAVLK